ncbi:MAG: regulatory protein FmdB family [Gemmatimonadales bacterium]|jgi:putative FmdB family regulatory protein|nr:regulatory protein FmdB family [Gemmatimonadales bacterium]
MPTYEFRCPKGHEFEQFYRSIGSAPAEVACPVCGSIAERQLSAGGGLVFKGSGFYITDYGKDGKKSQTPPVKAGDSAPAASGSDSGSKSDSGGKVESKPTVESKPATEPKPAPPSKSAAKSTPKREKGSE